MFTRYPPRRRLAIGLFAIVVTALPLTLAARPLTPAGPTAMTGAYDNGTVLPNGRLVTPAGRTFNVGDFPLGVAVSPDGRLAVSINSGQGTGLNGGFDSYCNSTATAQPCPYRNPPQPLLAQTAGISSTHAPDNGLSVVDLRAGRVRNVAAVATSYTPPTHTFNFFYVGVTFSPDGRHLYASGGGNDQIYDFPVRKDVVGTRPIKALTLPATTANDPTTHSLLAGFTKGMTVTPNGKYLLVAHEINGTLDVVNTKTYAVSQLSFGNESYPYSVAVAPNSTTAYVSLQGLGQVAQVSLVNGVAALMNIVPVGDHPTGITVSPDGSQVYVANSDDDTLSVITTSPAPLVAATITLHALPGEQLGSTPNAVAVSLDGQRIYVALAGDDALAVLGTASSFTSGATGSGRRATASPAATSLTVGGLIPTGWYPSGVAVSPDGSRVFAVSAKGLGERYPLNDPSSPYPQPPMGQPYGLPSTFYYDANTMAGVLQTIPAPNFSTLQTDSATVRDDIAFATTSDANRSPSNPIPNASLTGASSSSPIKYVIEIVRENRTFDQQLGDLNQDTGRAIDSYAPYAIFGRSVTPNMHALVGDVAPASTVPNDPAYATSDNFYSDGEASIQGHWWTAAANVNDYTEKSWREYYSPRNRSLDLVSTLASPRNCTLFQSATKKAASDPLFTYRNYGEVVGVANTSISAPIVGTSLPTASSVNTCDALPAAQFDATGSNNAQLAEDNRPTATAFLTSIGLNSDGMTSTLGLALPTQYSLRNFSYLILGGDHTGGLSNKNTPRALVAMNDAGIGMIVSALSRSKYWPQTAIFVMEDDSQDGLDHRDGHRNLLYVVSPYAKHVGADSKPGYIGHLHYDQAGVIKTIELILGFPFLSTYDQNASPLYDLFQDKNAASQLTAQDLAPYTVQPAPSFIDETSAAVIAGASSSARLDTVIAESKRLNLSAIDRAGPLLEIVNWQLAKPNQPVPPQLVAALQAWNVSHGLGDKD